jgi:hypothetical protein
MRYLISFIFAGIFALFTSSINFWSTDSENPKNKAFVVEQLFTSQGCSNCPSADRALEGLKNTDKNNENVVLLSYHVDYWNRLGWKDPFSKAKYTNLQRSYGDSYTPQAVINGKYGFVGSNRSKLNRRVKEALNTSAKNSVKISKCSKSRGKITFDYQLNGSLNGEKLVAALALENRKTKIGRGENGGKTLSNSNVVVNQKILKPKQSGTVELKVPKLVKDGEPLLLAIFIQKDDLEITGASKKHLP